MINISPKQLQAFIAVAEHRSFASAAQFMHLSQPALSMAIKNLEQMVGGKLLVRTTRSLSLSPEGQAFLPVAKRLLSDWDTAFNDLHNLFAKQRGKLSIAAMPSFAGTRLPELLAEFNCQYPNINVLIDDIVAEQVNDRVHSGHAEIGIIFRPDDLSDLHFVPLFKDRFVAAIPKDHSLANKRKLSWRQITQYPLLLLRAPSSIRAMIDINLRANGLEPNVEMEAQQLATLGKMVASGLGISVVPTLCIEQMEALGACCRPLVSPEISREVGIVYRQNSALSAAAEAMIELLQQRLG